ncbi:N-acetylneuraminate 7-O(or 9-O)-acetyltransferase [Aureococcus anophagefferens]|nr:N-acetylneuraminate 7-O(or 9-O)-acetyltransferase [Aureococcus anophagefferens]
MILGDSISRYFTYQFNNFLINGDVAAEFGDEGDGCLSWGCATEISGVYSGPYFDSGKKWSPGTERSDSSSHRQIIEATIDGGAYGDVTTTFRFTQDTWYDDLEDEASEINEGDVLIVNSGWPLSGDDGGCGVDDSDLGNQRIGAIAVGAMNTIADKVPRQPRFQRLLRHPPDARAFNSPAIDSRRPVAAADDAPTSPRTNGVLDGTETDIDCGGGFCDNLVNKTLSMTAQSRTSSYAEPHLDTKASSVAFSFYDGGDSDDDDDGDAPIPAPPSAGTGPAVPSKDAKRGMTYEAARAALEFAVLLGVCVVGEHRMPRAGYPRARR